MEETIKLKIHWKATAIAVAWTTDGVREEFRHINPTDRTPGEHEAGGIDHDGEHRDGARGSVAKGQRHTERTYSHTDRATDKQRLTAKLLDGEHRDQREADVHHAHDDRLHHRVAHTHIREDTRRIIEHGIDTHRLLEDGKHDTHKDAHETEREQFLLLLRDRILNSRERLLSNLETIDP